MSETQTRIAPRLLGSPESSHLARLRHKRRKLRNRLITRLLILGLAAWWLFNPIRSILTFKQIDDYPMYTMTWYGSYNYLRWVGKLLDLVPAKNAKTSTERCTLIDALGDPARPIHGRNFDWDFSPALILRTDSPQGNASLTVVNLFYLGFTEQTAKNPPWWLKLRLLMVPGLPFEGINEHGLTITTASIPNLDPKKDPARENMYCLGMIRVWLDLCRNTEEALALMPRYNITFPAGPNVHYLISDAQNNSAVAEVMRDEVKVFRPDQPYQVATNFYLAERKSGCWRYDKAEKLLAQAAGRVTPEQAINILKEVRMSNTEWSIVYDIAPREMTFVPARKYNQPHVFKLKSE